MLLILLVLNDVIPLLFWFLSLPLLWHVQISTVGGCERWNHSCGWMKWIRTQRIFHFTGIKDGFPNPVRDEAHSCLQWMVLFSRWMWCSWKERSEYFGHFLFVRVNWDQPIREEQELNASNGGLHGRNDFRPNTSQKRSGKSSEQPGETSSPRMLHEQTGIWSWGGHSGHCSPPTADLSLNGLSEKTLISGFMHEQK